MSNENLIINLKGRIDSANAAAIEAEINKQLEENPGVTPVFNAKELTYISSAGLRILMKIKKTLNKDISVYDVSPDIYEIFDTTGFTSLLNVKKQYRELSLDGCKIIGKGYYGTVYRLDADTIVKKYESPEALSIIENEKKLSKLAFVAGIPTAISFDIVKIGDSYGSVFELLNSKTFIDLIIENPQDADNIIKKYAHFLRKLHQTEMPSGVLPSSKDIFLSKLDNISSVLPENTEAKLRTLISSLPYDNHFVHGDCHLKNIMLSDGEPMLIDMDTISTGQPIFDLQGPYVTYVAFCEDEPDNAINFSGISLEMAHRIWNGLLANYYDDKTEDELNLISKKITLAAYINFMNMIVSQGPKYNELNKLRIKHSCEHLSELADSIDDLTI